MMTSELKRALKYGAWGFVGGIVLTLLVGFTWGGWYSAHGAQQLAQDTSAKAVNAALLPFCAQAFVAQATPEQKATFQKTPSYSQGQMIADIVKMPGITIDYGLRNDCADAAAKLMKQTAASQG